MNEADLFLQVLDATSRYKDEEMRVIHEILEEMGLSGTPRILVWNKIDLLKDDELQILHERISDYHAVAVSAAHGIGLEQLKEAVSARIFSKNSPLS